MRVVFFSHYVAMLQTKVGDKITANTLSHDVATLQTKVGDEDVARSLSHKVAQLEENKLDLTGGVSLTPVPCPEPGLRNG